MQLAVEEDFLLLVLDHEAGLADRVAIVALLIVLLLVALFIGGLRVRFAVENHLLPRLEPLENVQHVLVLWIVRLTWAHKRPILQAIVLELSLVFLGDSEGLQAALVLELEASLSCAVLHEAEDLDEELRVLDYAAVPADSLVGDVGAADLALVLNLDELDVSDEAEHFDDVPDDLIRRDRLDKLYLVVGLEIGHLVSHLADDLEV